MNAEATKVSEFVQLPPTAAAKMRPFAFPPNALRCTVKNRARSIPMSASGP